MTTVRLIATLPDCLSRSHCNQLRAAGFAVRVLQAERYGRFSLRKLGGVPSFVIVDPRYTPVEWILQATRDLDAPHTRWAFIDYKVAWEARDLLADAGLMALSEPPHLRRFLWHFVGLEPEPIKLTANQKRICYAVLVAGCKTHKDVCKLVGGDSRWVNTCAIALLRDLDAPDIVAAAKLAELQGLLD